MLLHSLFLETHYLQEHQGIFLAIFLGIVAAILAFDLGIWHRDNTVISFKSALLQSSIWVSISLCFGILLIYHYSREEAWNYYAAYVTEYALSVDNIFVIILILRYFKVEQKYYHKVLVYGILGAVLMRGGFIVMGNYLIQQFSWVLYLFGGFLLYTGFRMLTQKEDAHDVDPTKNKLVRLLRRYLRFTNEQREGKFFIRTNGTLFFTPLFMVVLLIESTDLIFAIDSIPAAFGITRDPFIIFTSNIFAVLGLRAMFFMLSGILDRFWLLNKGLSLVLIFIGGKMLMTWYGHLSAGLSLGIIVSILFGSILLSLLIPNPKANPKSKDRAQQGEQPTSQPQAAEMEHQAEPR